jgi:acyl-coenzyme A thioesterase PaaI-like protein
MKELENDPDNPCFGCGPNNTAGLRLKFFEDNGIVTAETTLDDRFSAWPGQVHGGVAFAALECTCQWTFYTLKHRSGPTMKFKVDFPSRIRVGEPIKLVGSVLKKTAKTVSVRAELVQGSVLRAFMEQDIRVVKDLAEFRKLRPSVKIDRVMKRNLSL